jgi:hypothetical protein
MESVTAMWGRMTALSSGRMGSTWVSTSIGVASLSICKFLAVLHVNAATARAFPMGLAGIN